MQVDDIRRLVEIFQESDIDELEVCWGEGRTIRMTRRIPNGNGGAVMMAPQFSHPTGPQVTAASSSVPPEPAVPDVAAPTSARGPAEEGLVEIRSPMVGTFYRASSPEAPPYVEVGSRVEKGQVVCIVEAMKLMNEIESEVAGTITQASIDNSQPIEFNQTLFLVKPD